MPGVAALIVATVWIAAGGWSERARDGKPPAALVTVATPAERPEGTGPEMLRVLTGGIADLDARDAARLEPAQGRAARPDDELTRRWVIRTAAAGKRPAGTREILERADGGLFVRDTGETGAEALPLDRERLRELALEWPAYFGPWVESEVEPGVVVELPRPYAPGWFQLDKPTLSRRVLGGREVTIDRADRVLSKEVMWVRLPRGYSPRRPAGLVVWIDAGTEGRPPEALWHGLDRTGMICIGVANCGNDRPIADRLQLALDAVETARRRLHVDRERVYTSGVSGGGKVASMLWGCFPDVFAGCVLIVGLASYQPVPAGMGKAWPPQFARPDGKLMALLKRRRLAAITGNRDFNMSHIVAAGQMLRGDGLDVRVDEFADQGHTLPTPDRFADALAWVDEPARNRRTAEVAAGAKAMKAYRERWSQKHGKSGAEVSDTERADLVRVLEAGPWTEEAWEAAELLGLTLQSPDETGHERR